MDEQWTRASHAKMLVCDDDISIFLPKKTQLYSFSLSLDVFECELTKKNKHQNQTSTFAMDKSENKNKYKSHIASIVWSKIKNTKRLALMKKKLPNRMT